MLFYCNHNNDGCYILFSEKQNHFYVGATQEDVNKRIMNHNSHGYGKHRYTATTNDWTLFLFIQSNDYAQSIRMEKHIKKNEKQNVHIKSHKIS